MGTGTYGQNSPTIINCGFKPKQIIIYAIQNYKNSGTNYGYVSINGSSFSYKRINIPVNTCAPNISTNNARSFKSEYLFLKIDEETNKIILGSTTSNDNRFSPTFILNYNVTNNGLLMYCDQYVFSDSAYQNILDYRTGGTQLNEQNMNYCYVIFG